MSKQNTATASEENMTTVMQIRLTPSDKQRISDLAAADHRSPSEWARLAVLQAAKDAEWQATMRPESLGLPPDLVKGEFHTRY